MLSALRCPEPSVRVRAPKMALTLAVTSSSEGKVDHGEVPEWSNGPVSKTGVPLSGTVGSNPTLSAIYIMIRRTEKAVIFE